MYGFLTSFKKILKIIISHPLTNKTNQYPQLCCYESTKYPHKISKISQITLKPLSQDHQNGFIPLFVILAKPDNTFYLVFYPDPNDPPFEIKDNLVLSDYWSNIQPMFLCKNIWGYYLGLKDNPDIARFKISDQEEGSDFLITPQDFSDFSKSYGKNIIFNNELISIKLLSS